jgi:hypothetical protein
MQADAEDGDLLPHRAIAPIVQALRSIKGVAQTIAPEY